MVTSLRREEEEDDEEPTYYSKQVHDFLIANDNKNESRKGFSSFLTKISYSLTVKGILWTFLCQGKIPNMYF